MGFKAIGTWNEGDWIAAIAAIALGAVLVFGLSLSSRKSDEVIGHPKGLFVLFYAEMWERFSYYSIRPLLVLFMVATVSSGGFGFSEVTASAIYGIFAGSLYLAAVPGGWLADNWLGQERALWWGSIIIALGHLCIALS